METKGITCKIPLDLHNRVSEDIRQSESTMSKFIEMVINEHYMKGANGMSKMRTMAFQVSEEFFQRIKDYLTRYEQTYGKKLSQKDFVIGLIEQALEEADEEFEAAQAAQEEASGDSHETLEDTEEAEDEEIVPFPVSWTVKMKKKQKETQDILSYHTQAAGCSDKARAKASGGRQPIEECGRTGL